MNRATATHAGTNALAAFHLADLLLGIDVERIQEVMAPLPTVPVRRAPDGVVGLVNLRGQIVAITDVRQRLGLPARESGAGCVHVIVRTGARLDGLVVDREGDVVAVAPGSRLEAPPTVDPGIRAYVTGIHALDGQVLLVLDVDRLLARAGEGRVEHAGTGR